MSLVIIHPAVQQRLLASIWQRGSSLAAVGSIHLSSPQALLTPTTVAHRAAPTAAVRSSRLLTALLATRMVGEGNSADPPSGLAEKKCVPCSKGSGLTVLPIEEAKGLLQQVPGWELVEGEDFLKIRKKWKARNFKKGLELLSRVGEVAEAEGHHPDLHLEGWNNVRIDIFTHSIGGLHENDFILAAKIDAIEKDDLLRKPKA